MAFPPETSVVSHTIAFQAFLAKKNTGQPNRVSVIIFWYVMIFRWCRVCGEGQSRPRILENYRAPENYRTPGNYRTPEIIALQKIIALQGWHRTLSAEIYIAGKKTGSSI